MRIMTSWFVDREISANYKTVLLYPQALRYLHKTKPKVWNRGISWLETGGNGFQI